MHLLGIGRILLYFECEDVESLTTIVLCCLLMYLQTVMLRDFTLMRLIIPSLFLPYL